ncbi:alpha/beta hydrolase [Brevibacterium litoralis]|uniref:alpha/beta hydrolase n=1 Tax=Brevibacterium litoralis TaxID=3138935 RepID=UPI0032EDBDF0
MSVGARAVASFTAARSRAGALPGRDQTLAFLGPEPTGDEAAHFHVREKRKLSGRLREFFVHSPALGRTVGVRVLLPGVPSEVADVVYLFHGGGDDFRSWTDLGDAEALTADSPYLVVMPDAGAASYSHHTFPGADLDWPRFHTEELPAFIDDRYFVNPERDGQILAGLSMGGYAAVKYAAQHPDQYCAAAAFSSPFDTLAAVPLFDIITLREGGPARSLFGDPRRDSGEWLAQSPVALAENLADTDLWFSAGSGDPDPDEEDASADVLEAMVHHHGERLHERLTELRIPHRWHPRATGGHSWATWQRELAAWLDGLPARLMERAGTSGSGGGRGPAAGGGRGPAAGGGNWPADGVGDGAPFSFTTGEPVFSVHGWDVAISRRRAQLVTFAEVTPSGFTLNGAGTFRVSTPPLFPPEGTFRITVDSPLGGNVHDIRADENGRLHITGRMAGALHDPIVPGRRTRHFRTWGQEERTQVRIEPVSVPAPGTPAPVRRAAPAAEARSSPDTTDGADHDGLPVEGTFPVQGTDRIRPDR